MAHPRPEYTAMMATEGRLIALFEEDRIVGYVTYLLAPSIEGAEAYYHRDLRTLPREMGGPVAYIEQLEGTWSRELLQQVREVLLTLHPDIRCAVWYRATRRGWRRYTLTKEGVFHGEDTISPCRQPR